LIVIKFKKLYTFNHQLQTHIIIVSRISSLWTIIKTVIKIRALKTMIISDNKITITFKKKDMVKLR
jgi:hypothetical protein